MALEPKFRKSIEADIRVFVGVIGETSKDLRRVKKIWKYEHGYDFVYGFVVGMIYGQGVGIFKMTYGRLPNTEEGMELREMVESHAKTIRDILARVTKK